MSNTTSEPPLSPETDLKGKIVLITGATAGIGLACAWRFAKLGCNLVLIGRRESNLKQEITSKYNVLVEHVRLDVRDINAVQQLPTRLPEQLRAVDILVANAGLALGTSGIQDQDVTEAQTMIDTNITGVVAFIKTFTSGMVARGFGHVFTMSSIAARESYGGGAIYCATKHAIRAITEAARHDLIHTPIRVTSISPGAVETEFSIVRFDGDVGKAKSVYQGFEPLTGADIADNVIYAATRPAHVQITDIETFATSQASAKTLYRGNQ